MQRPLANAIPSSRRRTLAPQHADNFNTILSRSHKELIKSVKWHRHQACKLDQILTSLVLDFDSYSCPRCYATEHTHRRISSSDPRVFWVGLRLPSAFGRPRALSYRLSVCKKRRTAGSVAISSQRSFRQTVQRVNRSSPRCVTSPKTTTSIRHVRIQACISSVPPSMAVCVESVPRGRMSGTSSSLDIALYVHDIFPRGVCRRLFHPRHLSG
jgi:hypothetical protein